MSNEEEVKKFLTTIADSFKILLETLPNFQKQMDELLCLIQQRIENENTIVKTIMDLDGRLIVLEKIIGNKMGKELDSFLQRVPISGKGN